MEKLERFRFSTGHLSEIAGALRGTGMSQKKHWVPGYYHKVIDRHGCPFMGADEDGFWFGTAAWAAPVFIESKIARGPVWVVQGWLGPDPFIGYFRGPQWSVSEFVTGLGVKCFAIERA
jgi:hypothetical protein